MTTNKEHFATTLSDLTKKCDSLSKDIGNMMVHTGQFKSKLGNYYKFTKELNQAVNQECIKALAFN